MAGKQSRAEIIAMRIFVVGTGRCGTSTFYHAACHATNYTVGHESRAGTINDYLYPDHRIEVSSHLAFAVPVLRATHSIARIGASGGCRFVHLIRELASCVSSMAAVREAIRSLAFGIAEGNVNTQSGKDFRRWAAWLYDLVNANIAATAADAFRLELERAEERWLDCWEFMGCEGDFEASLAEWRWKYNPGVARGRDRRVPK